MIRRRSSLRRTGIRRAGSVLRSVPLRQVSKKRARENRDRTAMLRPLQVAANGVCPCCGRAGQALHGHEIRAAAQGGSRTDPANVIPVCDFCNGRFEDEPIEAAARGWKLSRKHPGPDDGVRVPWPVPWEEAA